MEFGQQLSDLITSFVNDLLEAIMGLIEEIFGDILGGGDDE